MNDLPNFLPSTIWTADNLPVMRRMNSESVDLIYLDPPFNSKHDYAAPIGSQAAGAAFKDTWTLDDVKIEWIDELEAREPHLFHVILAAMTPSDKSYLVYMAMRLLEMRRILKPTASIYLHCDPTMSHYLKLLMDAVFGRGRFRNEIVWCYRGGGVPRNAFARKHDIILSYAMSNASTFNRQYVPYSEASQKLVKSRGGVSIDGIRRDLARGAAMPDWWVDLNSLQTWSPERTGYPTQKPLGLLDRIIRAGSNPGDLVFDPFCGCATTMVAAHSLGDRQWVGIDISPKAVDLVVERITNLQGSMFKDFISRNDIPQRTDQGELPPYNCAANKRYLYGQQAGHCAGCGEHFAMRHLEVDHIIAASHGGTDHMENLQLLCGNCNRTKGNRGMSYLRRKLLMVT